MTLKQEDKQVLMPMLRKSALTGQLGIRESVQQKYGHSNFTNHSQIPKLTSDQDGSRDIHKN